MRKELWLLAIVGLNLVHCRPEDVTGRQETETSDSDNPAVAVAALGTVSVAPVSVPVLNAAVGATVDLNVDVNGQVKNPLEHSETSEITSHKFATPNLLSAIGHVTTPLLKGILEPLFINVVYGIVGGVVHTIQHPGISMGYSPASVYGHGQEHEYDPTKFPALFEPEKRAENSATGFTTLFDGFDAYVMKVPGQGKYLFISSEKNLADQESNKNTEGEFEEIPFSANPLLNSLFGSIRVRTGPIPNKNVENYVKQQLADSSDTKDD